MKRIPNTRKRTSYQLFRVYGDVEPHLLRTKVSTWEALRDLVIRHLRAEPYDDQDGLFVLVTDARGRQHMESFSGGEMDNLRERAEA